MAEPRISRILRSAGRWMDAGELLDRYCADGATRSTAYNAVSQAWRDGWIKRQGVQANYQYAVADQAPSQDLGQPRCSRGVRAVPQTRASAYVGPAFGSAPLSPAIGLVCGDPEVMPPEVARVIDRLHTSFYEQFHKVE